MYIYIIICLHSLYNNSLLGTFLEKASSGRAHRIWFYHELGLNEVQSTHIQPTTNNKQSNKTKQSQPDRWKGRRSISILSGLSLCFSSFYRNSFFHSILFCSLTRLVLWRRGRISRRRYVLQSIFWHRRMTYSHVENTI